MAVYFTGDTHGFHDLGKLFPHNWGEGYQLTKDDFSRRMLTENLYSRTICKLE